MYRNKAYKTYTIIYTAINFIVNKTIKTTKQFKFTLNSFYVFNSVYNICITKINCAIVCINFTFHM